MNTRHRIKIHPLEKHKLKISIYENQKFQINGFITPDFVFYSSLCGGFSAVCIYLLVFILHF